MLMNAPFDCFFLNEYLVIVAIFRVLEGTCSSILLHITRGYDIGIMFYIQESILGTLIF